MVLEQISHVFYEVFDEPNLCISEGTNPADIPDWDSVAQVKLVLAIEEEFGVRFSSDEITEFRCVGDVARSVRKKTGFH